MTDNNKQEPLLVNEREAAKLLSVSPRTIWARSASGELPIVRIGRSKRYDVSDLRAFIEAQKTGGGRDA